MKKHYILAATVATALSACHTAYDSRPGKIIAVLPPGTNDNPSSTGFLRVAGDDGRTRTVACWPEHLATLRVGQRWPQPFDTRLLSMNCYEWAKRNAFALQCQGIEAEVVLVNEGRHAVVAYRYEGQQYLVDHTGLRTLASNDRRAWPHEWKKTQTN